MDCAEALLFNGAASSVIMLDHINLETCNQLNNLFQAMDAVYRLNRRPLRLRSDALFTNLLRSEV